jgi:AcrR family transcriptional regulator
MSALLAPAPPQRLAADELLPEGTAPPADIAPEIFAAALSCYLQCKRLDMRGLAGELGMGRATLYRKVGSRDRLLAEVTWYLTRRLVLRALRDTQELEGQARVLAVVEHYARAVSEQVELRRFLEAEPEAALRILTSKHGHVQAGLVTVLERLLVHETGLDRTAACLDASTLAYVVVRIGESFLYADVIGHGEPDVDTALDVIERLLDATVTSNRIEA